MSATCKAEFPLLAAQPDLRYLDSAATAQIHRTALDAVVRHETTQRANVMRGTYRLAEAADRAYEAARRSVAGFLNAASAEEVVFTSGATSALNLVAHSFGQRLGPGDRIVASVAEHHSNLLPWQVLRQRQGVDLVLIPLGTDGRLDLSRLDDLVDGRTRLVALTQCSNVTGAITDVAAVVAAARRVGARVLLDGAQAVQHGPQDVQALGVDFYAFSGHKAFGPGGVGVLWARAEVLAGMPPFHVGGGMVGAVTAEGFTWAEVPRRFEAGTPPIAPAVGLAAALDWMRGLDWPAQRVSEAALCARLLDGLRQLPGLRVLGPTDLAHRAPIVSFEIAGLHPHDICQVLDGRGLALRGGHHCAQPLLAALGTEACTRASFALYNDEADVEALLDALRHAIRVLA